MLLAYRTLSDGIGSPRRMSPTTSTPGRSSASELIQPGAAFGPQPQCSRRGAPLTGGAAPSVGDVWARLAAASVCDAIRHYDKAPGGPATFVRGLYRPRSRPGRLASPRRQRLAPVFGDERISAT